MKLTNDRLAWPHVCHICGSTPEPGKPVIDTERSFEFNEELVGRKYVCDRCAGEISALVKPAADSVGAIIEEAYMQGVHDLADRIRDTVSKIG